MTTTKINKEIATVELGTRTNEDTWENEIVEADWFLGYQCLLQRT